MIIFLLKYWKTIAFTVLCAACFAGGWYVKGNIENAKKAAELNILIQNHVEAEKKADEKSTALETQLATLRDKTKKLNKKLEKEIAKNSVYNTCVVPDDGVRLLNEAVAAGQGSR